MRLCGGVSSCVRGKEIAMSSRTPGKGEGIQVLYTDPNFLVLQKPAGILVHSVRVSHPRKKEAGSGAAVTDWLCKHYPEVKTVGDDPAGRPGIVHRLDKETSGVLVVARTQAFFEYMKNLFQRHEVKKEYTALVWGRMKNDSGTIALPIGLRTGTTRRTTHLASHQRKSETSN